VLPHQFRPMLASPVERPFDHPGYLFEPKCDGFRGLVFIDGGRVTIFSRNLRDVTRGYPEVMKALGSVAGDAVLDGELVVCDEEGVPHFQFMQQRNFDAAPPRSQLEQFPVQFVAFDLCWRDGVDLRDLPLAERRAQLEAMPVVQCTQAVIAHGCALYDEATALGFEGVVGKALDSPYRPGLRSRAWRKVKRVLEAHAVVVGYTAGTGGRSGTLGSLVLGQWDGARFVHIGEVGTGFDDGTLRALRMALDEIVVPDAPVALQIRIPQPITWVEPGVVVRVEHRGVTHEGMLRAASFKGIVVGFDPREVVKP